jgi:hypothetical protein
MSAVDLGKFACDSCQRQYPWKPEYAGRKVKCKCGHVITAPTEAPNASSQHQDPDDLLGGLYDLAAQEQQAAQNQSVDAGLRCPSCQADMLVGETVCPNCNFNLKTGLKERAQKATGAMAGKGAAAAKSGNPMLAYAGMSKRSAAQAQADAANSIGGSQAKELYVPAALVLLGFFATLFQYGYAGGAWRGIGYAIPAMSLAVLFNLVLCFVGVAIVAKLFDLGFGSPGPAVLKLVAICLLPSAIGSIIGNMVGQDSGFVRFMVPAILILPITEGLFVYLFDLAFDEAIYTSVIIYLVNQWAVMFLIGMFIAGVATPFGTSLGGSGHSRSAAIVKADETAADEVDRPNATEARSWLGESNNHMYEGETHDSSSTLVQDLYDAGAKKCTTLSDRGAGYALIVEIPSKQATRDKIFAVIKKFETDHKTPAEDQTTDEGQHYHTFEFSPSSFHHF